jgi:hypothetical protein
VWPNFRGNFAFGEKKTCHICFNLGTQLWKIVSGISKSFRIVDPNPREIRQPVKVVLQPRAQDLGANTVQQARNFSAFINLYGKQRSLRSQFTSFDTFMLSGVCRFVDNHRNHTVTELKMWTGRILYLNFRISYKPTKCQILKVCTRIKTHCVCIVTAIWLCIFLQDSNFRSQSC